MKKAMVLILGTALLLALLTACSSGKSPSSQGSSISQEPAVSGGDSSSQPNSGEGGEESTVLGQVTAIEGNTLTITLGARGQGGANGFNTGSGAMENGGDDTFDTGAGSKARGNAARDAGEAPVGDQTAPDGSGAAQVPGSTPDEGMTGEIITVTVDDTVRILQTVEDNNSTEAALEDIQVGSLVQLIYQDGNVTQIILQSWNGNEAGSESGPQSESGSTNAQSQNGESANSQSQNA